MKMFLLLWITSLVLFSQNYQKNQSNKDSIGEINNQSVASNAAIANQLLINNEIYNYKNRTENLEYEIQAQPKKRKSLKTGAEEKYISVNYTVKNRDGKDYILFNRGHSIENDSRQIYVEFQANGIAELSQKAFAEPKDVICPNRDAPILPKATRLKAGQSISGQAEVVLPLRWKTPFDDCYKERELPKEITGFKFCLGITEADKVEISAEGYISGQYLKIQKRIGKQQLLCSETFELK